jgi:hypothetical protein
VTSSYDGEYRSWSEVSGYFDGDGTVEFSVKEYRIEIRLAFDDNWKPFLEGLRRFLVKKSIVAGTVRRKQGSKTWHHVVSQRRSVLRMAKAMSPRVVKKRDELIAVIRYLEGHSTGKEFVEVMNTEVASGQRTGKLRTRGPDYTHGEGIIVSRLKAESVRRQKRLTPVPEKLVRQILSDRTLRRLKYDQLSAKYGYTRWVLRRVIRDNSHERAIQEEHKKQVSSGPFVGR